MHDPLLFLSAHLPSQEVPEAGQKIAFSNLMKYNINHDIHLVCFANDIERCYYRTGSLDFCSSVTIIPVTSIGRCCSAALHPLLPLKVAARSSRLFTHKIKTLINTVDFKAAHLEFTAIGQYIHLLDAIPFRIIVEHDISYQLFERKARAAGPMTRFPLLIEAFRLKRWELRALDKFDRVVTLNSKDRSLLLDAGLSPSKIEVRPPSIDDHFRQVQRNRVEAGSLLLWGAFGREENSDAARWFLDDIFPKILAHHPDCVVYLVGANPPADLLTRASAHVKVTGFVESPIPYFEKAQVSVAPLRLGAGVKLKVLEALAARIPVVATEVGAEGIDDPLLVVANTADDFAHKVLQLIGSPVGEKDDESHSQ